MDKKSEPDLPDEYARGYAMFLGCKIDLSMRPLIPRPEPEFWTQRAIDDLRDLKRKGLRVLDIFSGSGCVGIAVARHLPGIRVDFSDIDPAAVKQIKINIKGNDIRPDLTNVFESDIFNKIPKEIFYDAILANPPYIDPARIGEVQKSVLDYEPRAALFAGDGGVEIIRKFLKSAKSRLRAGGFIYLEFDPSQADSVENMAEAGGYLSINFFNDQFGKRRFAKICD